MTVCVEASFSKTAERNKTPITGIQVLLKLSSNQQTDRKSVHSTRRYSNIKVPYQMTKMTHFRVLFPNTTHYKHYNNYNHNWDQFTLDHWAYGTHSGFGEQLGCCCGDPTEGEKRVYLGGLGGSFAE